MARQLDDPILRDTTRVIERSADIRPEFRGRLLDGLAAIDTELRDLRELVAIKKPAETDTKGKKR